jgi:hypothetical protein
MPKKPAEPIKPVKTEAEPRKAEAITRGGHKPADNRDAGKQPLSEPYGKATKGAPPRNPAHKKG